MVNTAYSPVDVLTMGRIGVDIYPLQYGVGLEEVTSFGKFLGGSPTNVAVAAARLGHTSAVITGVGKDPFGHYCRVEANRLGVDDRFFKDVDTIPTPVTFCEIFSDKNDFPLYFYRYPTAPDLQLTPDDIPEQVVAEAKIFWISVTGLSQTPSRAAHHRALQIRAKKQFTILDLDYRADFWESEDVAHQEVSAILPYVDVAVGNKKECQIAVGETDPHKAAQALLNAGVKLAIVKQGAKGTLAMTQDELVEVAPHDIQILNGLGAGDAFGGSLCHALLKGWSLKDTISAASAAGELVCTRLECSTAMPTEPELFDWMKQLNQKDHL